MSPIPFHEAGVPMTLEGATLTLLVCGRCHAVVAKDGVTGHTEWHRLLNDLLAAMQEE